MTRCISNRVIVFLHWLYFHYWTKSSSTGFYDSVALLNADSHHWRSSGLVNVNAPGRPVSQIHYKIKQALPWPMLYPDTKFRGKCAGSFCLTSLAVDNPIENSFTGFDWSFVLGSGLALLAYQQGRLICTSYIHSPEISASSFQASLMSLYRFNEKVYSH